MDPELSAKLSDSSAELDGSRGAALGDEVYEILGRAIKNGTLAPGQRVRDTELAAALGVSRTPVREALQRLERIGLIEVSAHRYTRVSEFSDKMHADVLEYVVYAVGFGLRMALLRSSDAEHAEAVRLADAMVAASEADDIPALAADSARFYEHVSKTADNAVFLTIMREAAPAFQRVIARWRPAVKDSATRTAGYAALRDAVATRDADRAEQVLRRQLSKAEFSR